jgi:hypothetical protein
MASFGINEPIERKLYHLRTLNPAVVTTEIAELGKWAAAEIERLMKELDEADFGPDD